MPIKYNNFDIGNAYLGNDNLVAMYQGSNLVWTNGIKLKSLLGNSNTQYTKTFAEQPSGSGIAIGLSNDTFVDGFQNTSKTISGFKENHKYLVIEKYSDNSKIIVSNNSHIFYVSYSAKLSTENSTKMDKNYVFWTSNATSNVDSGTYTYCALTTRIDYKEIEKNDTLTIESLIIIDLTKAKLDTLTPEQIYNLLTLNGTDFTDLELLANGYQVDLSKWKQQTTNSFKINEHNWTYDSSGKKFFTQVSDMKKISDMTISGVASANGYTTSTQNDLDSGTDMIITTNFEYIFIRDLRYTNQDDFKSAMGNTTITYELSSSNNIGGSKYGFIQIKDLTLTRADSGRFFGTLKPIKSYSTSQYANVFTEKLSVGKYGDYYSKSKDKIISSLSQDIQFYDSSCEKLDDFTEKYGSEYIVYELSNSLGNKLDNYSAEQVYYMFFSTLGNQKMYVPKGVEFESSDNVIIGTKYGIYQFDGTEIYLSGGTTGKGLYRYYTMPTNYSNVKVATSGFGSVDGYCDKLPIYDGAYNQNEIECMRLGQMNGAIYFYFTEQKTTQQLQEFMKGSFIIYELATPNGTDYNDLSAKQMYDLINDNQLSILANGKSIGGYVDEDGNIFNGIRSVVGNQNNLGCVNEGKTNDVWFGDLSYGVGGIKEDKILSVNLIANHKYFFAIFWKEQQDRSTQTWNVFEFFDQATSIINGGYFYNHLGYQFENGMCGTFIPTTSSILSSFRYCINNGEMINSDYDIYTGYVLIDLTQNDLANKTAQEVYQYFKEYNLYNLTTSGEIKIGGFMKPKPSNPTFTIDSVVYEYESGMTWGAWLDSSYNTGGFTHKEEYVVDSTNTYCVVKSDYSGKAYTYDYVESIAYIVVK